MIGINVDSVVTPLPAKKEVLYNLRNAHLINMY